MSDLDKEIREGYSVEDAELMRQLAEDPSMLRQVLNAFHGPFGAFNAVGVLVTLVLLAGGAYCVWRFSEATEVREMLTWAGTAAVALCAISMIKVWFWMELQRNATVREIKRLELQVSRLVARMAQ